MYHREEVLLRDNVPIAIDNHAQVDRDECHHIPRMYFSYRVEEEFLV